MTDLILSVTGYSLTWIDYTKIKSDDNDYTYFPLSTVPGQTDELWAVIDPLQLPVGSVVTGIQARIKKRARAGLNRCRDKSVYLYNWTTLVSTNKADPVDYPDDGSWRTDTYGSTSDMWGTSLSSSDLNSGNVNLRFICERYGGFVGTDFDVDLIEIQVTYEGGTTPSTETLYGPAIQVV